MKKNTNRKTPGAFVLESFFWLIMPYLLFRGALFRSLPGTSYVQSKIVLWCLLLLLSGLGCRFALKRHRNNLRIFVNTVTPYGVFTLLAYRKNLPVLMGVVVGLILLCSIVFLILRMKPPIRQPQHKKEIIKTRLRQTVWGSRVIAACVLFVLVAAMSAVLLTGHSLIPVQTPAEPYVPNSKYTMREQWETIGNLREEVWQTLSTKERMETLQTVANIEAEYLGLPEELKVVLLPDKDGLIAGYLDSSHAIRVNVDYLDTLSAEEMLNSICHEAEHAYQHRLVNVYDEISDRYKTLNVFQAAAGYKNEFLNYTDGDKNFDDYYMQSCEISAREAGKYRSKQYLSFIEIHFDDNL